MYIKGFYFGIVFTVSFVSVLSAWCKRPITCPCGDTRRVVYYTHCLNETREEGITCERWANCKTCEANITHCLSCPPERFGPTCAEVMKGKRRACLDPGLPEGGIREDTFVANDIYHPYILEGESLYFSCKEGFILVGPSFITCTSSGNWSNPLPRCEKQGEEAPALDMFCKHPGVDVNGMIEYPDSIEEEQMFPSTTRLKFKCKEGYKLQGHRVLFCLCTGQWNSDPPTCAPEDSNRGSSSLVHCEGRGPISNGRVVEYHDLDRQLPSYKEYGALYPVGTRLHYKCNEGYNIQGAKTIICESSGLWSAKEPECIEDLNIRKNPATNDDNQSKNFDSDINNIIRNVVWDARRTRSKHEKEGTANSNPLILQLFLL